MTDHDASPPPAPTKPSNRRARRLILVGVLLLVAVAVAAAVAVAPGESEQVAPEPGGGRDVAMIVAIVGAVSGVGSLLLGVADFVRNSLRYRSQTRQAEADWRSDGGYM